MLLLTGLGALFFTYYWADNFDPGEWEREELASCPVHLLGLPPLLTTSYPPGASAGIGEELAYHYAHLGSHLVLTAHTEAFLQKVRHPILSLLVGVGVR